jgi:hypothetical protein
MIDRQVPADAVITDLEIVRVPQMSAERLCAKPALEADYILLLDRASDRHRRPQRLLRRRGTPETGKSVMHPDNQSRELIGLDLIMPYVAGNDADDLEEIDLWDRILFCHRLLPEF